MLVGSCRFEEVGMGIGAAGAGAPFGVTVAAAKAALAPVVEAITPCDTDLPPEAPAAPEEAEEASCSFDKPASISLLPSASRGSIQGE